MTEHGRARRRLAADLLRPREVPAGVGRRPRRPGIAERDPTLGPLQISAGGMVAIGDEYAGDGADRVLDMARPSTALYVGGMGARGQELLQHDLPRSTATSTRPSRSRTSTCRRQEGGGGRRRAAPSCSRRPTSSARSATSPSASPPTRRPASPTCRSTRSARTRSKTVETLRTCSTSIVDVGAWTATDAVRPCRGATTGRGPRRAASRTRASGGPAPRQLGDDLDLLAERVAEASPGSRRRRRRARSPVAAS